MVETSGNSTCIVLSQAPKMQQKFAMLDANNWVEPFIEYQRRLAVGCLSRRANTDIEWREGDPAWLCCESRMDKNDRVNLQQQQSYVTT